MWCRVGKKTRTVRSELTKFTSRVEFNLNQLKVLNWYATRSNPVITRWPYVLRSI